MRVSRAAGVAIVAAGAAHPSGSARVLPAGYVNPAID